MFPEISRLRKASTHISLFRGLNRTVNTGFSRVSGNDGAVFTEFCDMQNLCSDDYPRLRTRKKRCTASAASGMTGIVSNLLIDDNRFIYMTAASNVGVLHVGSESYSVSAYDGTAAKHELVLYGNRVVMMPERLVFDLGTQTFAPMDFSGTTQSVDAAALNVARYNGGNWHKPTKHFKDFSIEKVELDDNGMPRPVNYIYEKASGLEDYFKQTNPPNEYQIEDAVEPWQNTYYQHWVTIKIGETVEAQGESPSGVYRCTEIPGGKSNTINGVTYNTYGDLHRFVRIDNTYVKISRNDGTDNDLFAGLQKGDWVKLSGMVHAVKKPMEIGSGSYWADVDGTTGHTDYPSGFWGNYLEVLNGGWFKLYYVDRQCIVIKASIDKSVPYTGPLTVERVMPQADSGLMLEVDNRLWTCSSQNHEIYSCKQGDCTNWQAYGEGISTDSYAATVGSEGGFTGIARQNDSVIFFKENWIIKLFGNKPSNFALASYNVPGVARGSEKSVVWINGVLYYLSYNGVCRYMPGGQPVLVSEEAFGLVHYQNGVAGRHGDKYYLSAQNESGGWELLVLDTVKGMWHKEDDTQMQCCVTYNNILYYIDGEGAVRCVQARNNLLVGEEESRFAWFFETPDLYGDDFGKKYISKLQIQLRAAEDMQAEVYAQFRREGAWVLLKRLHFEPRRHVTAPVPVRRSDYLRLRVEGSGEMEIGGLRIDFAGGSDKIWHC